MANSRFLRNEHSGINGDDENKIKSENIIREE